MASRGNGAAGRGRAGAARRPRLTAWRALWAGRGERGTSSLELAFVLPVFLLLILGTADFGFAIVLYNMVSETARDGARAAQVMVVPGDTSLDGDQAQIRTAALRVTGPLADLGSGFDLAATAETDADGYYFVKVVASTSYQPVAGRLFGVTNVPVRAASRLAVPCGKCQ
jgi:Flp pilus assembly protein TadG